MNPRTISEDAFRAEVQRAIELGLRSRFRIRANARPTFSVKEIVTDPGIIRNPDAYIGHCDPGTPRIVLGKSYDWGVKTCHLTGEHFYPPAPLGFFCDGDPARPVSPTHAMKQGFTISFTLLTALANRLNSVETLITLPGEITAVDHDIATLSDWSEQEFAMHQWGGDVDKFFRTHPAIDPQDIPGAIAAANAAPPESSLEAGKAFLRKPSSERRADDLPWPSSSETGKDSPNTTTPKP